MVPTRIPAKSLDTFGKLQELVTVVCGKCRSWVPPLSDIPKSISATSAGLWILGPCPPKLIAARGENLGDKQLGQMRVGLGLPDTSTVLYCIVLMCQDKFKKMSKRFDGRRSLAVVPGDMPG
eukprot:s24_g41.t1